MNIKTIQVKGLIVHSDNSLSVHSHRLYITWWDGKPLLTYRFAGSIGFDVCHDHHYAVITESSPGRAQHTHGFYAQISCEDEHVHVIRGVTGPAVPQPGGGHIHYFEGSVNGTIPHIHRCSGQTGNEIG